MRQKRQIFPRVLLPLSTDFISYTRHHLRRKKEEERSHSSCIIVGATLEQQALTNLVAVAMYMNFSINILVTSTI